MLGRSVLKLHAALENTLERTILGVGTTSATTAAADAAKQPPDDQEGVADRRPGYREPGSVNLAVAENGAGSPAGEDVPPAAESGHQPTIAEPAGDAATRRPAKTLRPRLRRKPSARPDDGERPDDVSGS